MRFLSVVLASTFALLSVAANAGEWPSGTKNKFIEQCQLQATSKNIAADVAARNCTCNANVIENKFTTDEIKKFNAGTPTPDMTKRLLSEIAAACSKPRT